MYDIRWDQAATDDMRRMKLRAHEVARLVDAVDEQLTHEPERQSRHKKLIRPEQQLPFEHAEPVWQLSVGEFRVFYDITKPTGKDVSEAAEAEEVVSVVRIRAVRHKPPHRTTKEIL